MAGWRKGKVVDDGERVGPDDIERVNGNIETVARNQMQGKVTWTMHLPISALALPTTARVGMHTRCYSIWRELYRVDTSALAQDGTH